jgi:hypothetical protein
MIYPSAEVIGSLSTLFGNENSFGRATKIKKTKKIGVTPSKFN